MGVCAEHRVVHELPDRLPVKWLMWAGLSALNVIVSAKTDKLLTSPDLDLLGNIIQYIDFC